MIFASKTTMDPTPITSFFSEMIAAVKHQLSFCVLSLVAVTLFLSSCTTSVSFTGRGSVSEDLKTFSVEPFDNEANLVVPSLAQDFTLEVTDIFLRQTRLKNITRNGDLTFSGAITRYAVTPVAIQGDETAGQNRLTISVKVFCEHVKDDEQSWDETFTQFSDFDATSSLADVEDELIADINEKLTQDIFNKTFSDW